MAKRPVARKSRAAQGSDQNQPGTGRIETFSDSVVAIIITIMVLNLKIPEGADRGLWQGMLVPLAPVLISYVVSFVVVGVMWVNHHQLMPTAPVATRPLMWWNNNLLFWMSLVPFVTGFLGANPFEPRAYALYGAVLSLCILGLMLLRLHIAQCTKTGRAVDAHHRRLLRRTAFGAALYAASVPLAYVSVYIAMAIFALVPAMFFLPEALPGKLPEELEE